MPYKIDPKKCIACGTCVAICPVWAIASGAGGKYEIDPKKCISCGTCADVCPARAIAK
jgi:formate hydrogenlyase subunit 6/NADH:ubiquinone oxidoreductase subunit I